MIDRTGDTLPGAMELAKSIDRLAKDGQLLFNRVSISNPKPCSSGGRTYMSANLSGSPPTVLVLVVTPSLIQRITATIANGTPPDEALAMVWEAIRQVTP